jgi:hypothetical protein
MCIAIVDWNAKMSYSYRMKRRVFSLFLLCMLLMACSSQQAVQDNSQPADDDARPSVVKLVPKEPEADKVSPQQEAADTAEVQQVFETIKTLIKNQDVAGFKQFCSDKYIAAYSDPQYLATRSSSPRLQNRGIVLKTVDDYIKHIEFPTQAGIDPKTISLEYIGDNRVKVWTVAADGSRYRVKEMENLTIEKTGNGWKIVN